MALICTVRGCGAGLGRHDGTLRCPAGHTFDRARAGYWNLLQPQDTRSRAPGDSTAIVDARSGWIARGFLAPLVDAVARFAALDRLPDGANVVDLGCGEGSLDRALFDGRGSCFHGIDLSTSALRRAARAWPAATWIVANADRVVPLTDRSVALAVSLFGRRPPAETARVLRPDGRFVVAVPAADDLIELRRAATGRGEERDRVAGVAAALAGHFALAARGAWRRRVRFDRPALEDALGMSYRGARRRERLRLAGVESLEVTISADLLRFEPLV